MSLLNAGGRGDACERERRHFRDGAPEAADPDRRVGIALLELDPHAGADLRHDVDAAHLAGDRNARHGPRRQRDAGDVRHDHLNAADLLGIDVVDHRRAVLAVIALGGEELGEGKAHGGTILMATPLAASR